MDSLLKILSENSSFTNAELAMMLGEPEDYIAAQIAEYEAQGIIKGYRALVNWEKVKGADVTALIEVRVSPKKVTGFDEVAERLMMFDEVDSLYLMAGAYDFAVFVKGKTIQDIASFVSRRLSTIDGVLSTATHFMLKRYKDGGVNIKEIDQQEDKRSMVL
ncbi:MAG: Lrp/AsnC family transcriptional regulator [Acutalibacteraceae bacterium]